MYINMRQINKSNLFIVKKLLGPETKKEAIFCLWSYKKPSHCVLFVHLVFSVAFFILF